MPAIEGLTGDQRFFLAFAQSWRQKTRDEALRLKSLAEKGQAAEAEARRMVEFDREKLAAFEYGRAIELAHQEWREMNEYHARMRLLVAHGYTGTWEDREFNESRARALLNHTKPQFRGWEWRYVHRLCSYSSLAKLAYGGRDFSDGELEIVRDAKKRVESLTLKGHTGPVCSASFSADGSRVLTSSVDGTAKVWDARDDPPVIDLPVR